MKKNLCLLLLGLLCLTGRAIPADPTPVRVTQPDGSVLTVSLHGDEFFHFTTTADGYTVVKNAAGYYTYARLDGGNLVSSGVVAHDKAQRTAADHAFLANVPKGLTSAAQAQSGTMKLNRRNSAMRRVGADGLMDYDNFRGLIILINYTDKKFTMPSPGEFYNDMVNTHDYTGYVLNGRRVSMTGSVRDYFFDNSAHIFDPIFDVVGPVNVNYTSTQHQGTNNSEMIFNAALEAADSLVNYSDYDTDGDGYVDMVFFLVAGLSSNYSGNNEDLLWPHMYYLFRTPAHDGVRFGLYACSTEIAGWAGYHSDVNGIGNWLKQSEDLKGCFGFDNKAPAKDEHEKDAEKAPAKDDSKKDAENKKQEKEGHVSDLTVKQGDLKVKLNSLNNELQDTTNHLDTVEGQLADKEAETGV